MNPNHSHIPNSPEGENIPNQFHQHRSTLDKDRPAVSLGEDPGTLFSAMPSMLGFTPKESLIIVGLHPVNDRTCGVVSDQQQTVTFKVGPVVRSDLDRESKVDAMASFLEAAADSPSVMAILLAVMPDAQRAVEVFRDAAELMQPQEVPVFSCHWAEEIVSGGSWATYSLATDLWEEQGKITCPSDNPLTVHNNLQGTLRFDDRRELEEWLNPSKVLLNKVATQHSDLLKDLGVFHAAVTQVMDGWVTLEEACKKVRTLRATARLCTETVAQKFIILCSIGLPSQVVRELLAHAARRTPEPYRHKIMYVLIQVLIGNGEGVAAFHTARRGLEEANTRDSWEDFQVFVMALKAGFAMAIVQEKSSYAAEIVGEHRDGQFDAAGRVFQALSTVIDWDAVAHLLELSTTKAP